MTVTPHSQRMAALAIFALLALAVFVRLGEERVWRHSEARCVAVVSEMVGTGDWLVPRLGGQVRLAKPPLFYWAGALASVATGDTSVLPLRVVSALAGLALAALVFAAGRALGGTLSGLASAAALGASALFVVRARTGDAEMLLALFCTAALLVFERLEQTRDRRLLPALAALFGLAFLTKATAAALNVFVPIGVWLTIRRELRLVLRPQVLAWAGASAALGLCWYAYIIWHVPHGLAEILGNAVQPLGASNPDAGSEHFRSVVYYLPRFPLQTLPAALLLPWVVARGVRTRFWQEDRRMRFVAVSAVSLLAAWSLVPQKQMHYLLPIVPLQAILVGDWVASWLRALAPRDSRVGQHEPPFSTEPATRSSR